MAKSKLQNAMILDENRFKIAKQNAVVPGGPENNTPITVEQSVGFPVTAQSIYGDFQQQYPQIGTAVINPMETKPSGLQQNFPKAGRGKNTTAYGLQQQPSTQMADALEGSRLANDASNRGLFTNMAMGPIGSQVVVPGQFPGNMPNTNGPFMQQFMPTASVNPMTPGANKTVIKKKSSKNKGKA